MPGRYVHSVGANSTEMLADGNFIRSGQSGDCWRFTQSGLEEWVLPAAFQFRWCKISIGTGGGILILKFLSEQGTVCNFELWILKCIIGQLTTDNGQLIKTKAQKNNNNVWINNTNGICSFARSFVHLFKITPTTETGQLIKTKKTKEQLLTTMGISH